MDVIRREEIVKLAARRGRSLVSIYLPTIRVAGLKEREENRLRFKNLVKRAEALLASATPGGLRKQDKTERLEPLSALIDDSVFWSHQEQGLAVLVGEQGLATYKVPTEFPETAVVSDRFHLKPFLTLLGADRPAYILAVSLNEVRLFRINRFGITPLETKALPKNITAALGQDDNERTTQHQTPEPAARGDSAGTVFHGHGGAKDLEAVDIERYLNVVAKATAQELRESSAPLIFAGVEELFPPFKDKCKYPHLLRETCLPGNHEHTSLEALHKDGLALLTPAWEEELEGARARLKQADTKEPALTTFIPEDAYNYAENGKVELLFAALGECAWGQLDEHGALKARHETQQSGDVDLLDRAALGTLATGGSVYILERAQLPDQAQVAALLRY